MKLGDTILFLDESKFEGTAYRTAHNWLPILDVDWYAERPINYLEIGAHYGANVISVANTYAAHECSKVYAIDPWADYDEYSEYDGQQKTIFKTYKENIDRAGVSDKVETIRGFSHKEVHFFPDSFFNIIYVDGNHEKEYVLEDGVISFRKLKKGGIIIFDDYGWCDREDYKIAVDSFIAVFKDKIDVLGLEKSQMFIKKL